MDYKYVCNLTNGSNTELESLTKFEIRLYLQEETTSASIFELPGSCANGTPSEFTDLKCSTKYKIAAYFVFPDENSSDCQVTNTSIEIATNHKDSSCPTASEIT